MLTTFENITYDLTEQEYKLLPILIRGFERHIGESNSIKAPEIIKAINLKKESYGLKNNFTEVRLRKLCNFIRCKGMIPLCSSQKGYFVSRDKQVIANQIQSLEERAGAIMASAEGLKKFINIW